MIWKINRIPIEFQNAILDPKVCCHFERDYLSWLAVACTTQVSTLWIVIKTLWLAYHPVPRVLPPSQMAIWIHVLSVNALRSAEFSMRSPCAGTLPRIMDHAAKSLITPLEIGPTKLIDGRLCAHSFKCTLVLYFSIPIVMVFPETIWQSIRLCEYFAILVIRSTRPTPEREHFKDVLIRKGISFPLNRIVIFHVISRTI
jgi:hypothetical protein